MHNKIIDGFVSSAFQFSQCCLYIFRSFFCSNFFFEIIFESFDVDRSLRVYFCPWINKVFLQLLSEYDSLNTQYAIDKNSCFYHWLTHNKQQTIKKTFPKNTVPKLSTYKSKEEQKKTFLSNRTGTLAIQSVCDFERNLWCGWWWRFDFDFNYYYYCYYKWWVIVRRSLLGEIETTTTTKTFIINRVVLHSTKLSALKTQIIITALYSPPFCALSRIVIAVCRYKEVFSVLLLFFLSFSSSSSSSLIRFVLFISILFVVSFIFVVYLCIYILPVHISICSGFWLPLLSKRCAVHACSGIVYRVLRFYLSLIPFWFFYSHTLLPIGIHRCICVHDSKTIKYPFFAHWNQLTTNDIAHTPIIWR